MMKKKSIRASRSPRDRVFDALDEAGLLDRATDEAIPPRRLVKLAAITDLSEVVREQRR